MNRRRFTLLEILVAVMVAAVLIPLTLRALMTVAGLDESNHYRRQADCLADLKLHELVATGAWSTADDSGSFGDDYPGYSWTLVKDSWSAGSVTLRRLDLTVHGPGRFGPTNVTLVSLVPQS